MNIKEKNSKLIEEFDNELNIEGYSKKTRDIYILYLKLFSKFINKDLKNIKNTDIVKYLSYLKKEKKISSSTVSLILSALKHFYNEYLKLNLDINIKLPRRKKKIPTVLTNSEIKKLIENTKSKRNKLIIKFIYSTGVRVSECVNMKIEDIDFKGNTAKVVSGKGSKDRMIILSKKWIQKYKKYLKNRSKKTEYLFCSKQNNKLSVDSIQKFLKKSAKKANIKKKVSPHVLRHSFATNLLENGVNIRYIQQLLGHSNLNTTQIYTKVTTNKLKDIKNPLDNM